MNDSG
jgi:hypothetical protein